MLIFPFKKSAFFSEVSKPKIRKFVRSGLIVPEFGYYYLSFSKNIKKGKVKTQDFGKTKTFCIKYLFLLFQPLK